MALRGGQCTLKCLGALGSPGGVPELSMSADFPHGFPFSSVPAGLQRAVTGGWKSHNELEPLHGMRLGCRFYMHVSWKSYLL